MIIVIIITQLHNGFTESARRRLFPLETLNVRLLIAWALIAFSSLTIHQVIGELFELTT